jgi:hypothetical protein
MVITHEIKKKKINTPPPHTKFYEFFRLPKKYAMVIRHQIEK